ncbi:hypothetical protein BD779DRAFT_1180873 [Infundibulicybe gibba]|nr:hypothetical protein BD779DRAFT_1180873 [Infundibulicybe gibba]
MTARPHPRRVIVDDTDPQIQYSASDHWILNADAGQWPFAGGNPDKSGQSGQPFRSTTHLAVSASSSLSFRFRGSSPQIFGTNINTLIGCFISGTGIPPIKWRPTRSNHMLQCDGTGFADEDGEYTVTLNASAVHPGPNALFWFDYITYIPSPSAPLETATLLVDSLDQAVVYTSGWQPAMNQGISTETDSSQFTFNFIGTSVTCVGFLPPQPLIFRAYNRHWTPP